ncbi:unannotated protein [freshwater metagenome]|uniref:Unannotated protein n=1 Tax=freshwater metagenome TaxID=449393 RepID=A0A6J6M152_9ZZZZ|nr:sulfurtransferase TusA family protein [Actinomycetota bacterium]
MREVNCLNLRCPLPIIEIAREIKTVTVGQSLVLLADDPATWPDLQAWARMTGNEVARESAARFTVTRRNQNDPGGH